MELLLGLAVRVVQPTIYLPLSNTAPQIALKDVKKPKSRATMKYASTHLYQGYCFRLFLIKSIKSCNSVRLQFTFYSCLKSILLKFFFLMTVKLENYANWWGSAINSTRRHCWIVPLHLQWTEPIGGCWLAVDSQWRNLLNLSLLLCHLLSQKKLK